MKPITFTIERCDPETDAAPHVETYTVDVNEGARVLHALHAVREQCDFDVVTDASQSFVNGVVDNFVYQVM